MLPEVRVARIVEAIGRYGSGRLSCLEAAEVLGMSERHFRRLRDRYEAEGAEGLIDRRRGRASGRRAPVDQIEWLLEQSRTRYWDFTTKHFHEHLVCDHGFAYGYTWTKLQLQPGFPIWNPPSPLSVARNRSTCNSPSNDGHLRADPDDWGPIGGVGGAEWHFCRRSGRTDPVGGDAKERGAVAHAGAGGGLSRSIRRRMSANRSRGMTTSAIWNVT